MCRRPIAGLVTANRIRLGSLSGRRHRRASALATKKPRQVAGLSSSKQVLPSCDTRQTHRDNTTAAPDHRKNPAEAGLSSLRGFAASRGTANPPIHYHSWLRSGDFAEKPRQRQKKPHQRERGLVGPDCLMRAAARGQNHQRQAHRPNAPAAPLVAAQRGDARKKKPRSAGKRAGLRSHEGRRKRRETATHTETLPQKRLHRTTERLHSAGGRAEKAPPEAGLSQP